jgi:hypothetical protein
MFEVGKKSILVFLQNIAHPRAIAESPLKGVACVGKHHLRVMHLNARYILDLKAIFEHAERIIRVFATAPRCACTHTEILVKAAHGLDDSPFIKH